MKRTLVLLFALIALSVGTAFADASYDIQVKTYYEFGCSDASYGWCGSPDTGFWTLTNLGSSTFTGTVGQVAVSNFGGDWSGGTPTITLAPGAHITIGTSTESSNIGGFNSPYDGFTWQNGILIYMSGSFDLGFDSTGPIYLSVYDKDIHSGVFRDGGCGSTDAYVLQGGCPTGSDTGDGFEVTQAPGYYEFKHDAPSSVPEPGSLMLLGSGMLGLGTTLRRKFLRF